MTLRAYWGNSALLARVAAARFFSIRPVLQLGDDALKILCAAEAIEFLALSLDVPGVQHSRWLFWNNAAEDALPLDQTRDRKS